MTEKDLKAIRIRSSPKPHSPSRPVWSSKSLSGGRPALQASDLSIEVALLLEVRGHPGCGSVRLERGSRVASPDEEVAADRVEAIGVDPRVGTETLDQLEAGPRSGDHADGDGVAGRDDRVVVQAEQDVVEGGDLGPVGRFGALRLIVEGDDSCLEPVRPDGASGKGGGDQRDPLLGGTRSGRLRSCSAMGMSDPSGPDFIPGITPGEQPWLYRVCYRRSRGPARWCPRRRRSARTSRSEAVLAGTKPTEPAQKMNGTSILVERLYTG